MQEDDERRFDLLAASLRSSTNDLRTFVHVLGSKLERAFPGRARIERRAAGLFSRDKRVERIELELGDQRYILVLERGSVDARRAKTVRGIVLKTERLTLEAWIEAVSRDLSAEAGSSEESRVALERLLDE